MALRAATWSLAALVLLAVGVGGASGRSLETVTALRIQVEGVGEIKDTGGQIDCGAGQTRCRATYTGSTTVTLTMTETDPTWTFNGWGGECSGDTTCSVDVTADTEDSEVIAEFDYNGGAV